MGTKTPKRVADSRNAVKRDALSEERGRRDAVLPVGQVSAPEVAAWSRVVLWPNGREDFQICALCAVAVKIVDFVHGSLFLQKRSSLLCSS